MIVAALTGSIGMGKSTVLSMFAELGAAVWSADDAVHRLYARSGAAVGPVGASFPGVVVDGAIDREKLSACVINDPARLRVLENIVHPLVGEDRASFIDRAKAAGSELAVLDIPLLFEGGGEGAFDAVIVVSAPAETQRARVLARPGMTAEKFEAIRARQTPDAEKRRCADYVIFTGQSLEATRTEVETVAADLITRFGAR